MKNNDQQNPDTPLANPAFRAAATAAASPAETSEPAGNRRLSSLESEVEEQQRRIEKINHRLKTETGERKALAARLVEMLEKDRRNVAMALHDEVGQSLTAIKLDLELLESWLEPGTVLEKVESARQMAVNTLKSIKNLSSELRPTSLETLGLLPAMQTLINNIKEYTGLAIHFYTKNIGRQLAPALELTVYRILQEALTNAAKHSQATAVFVNFLCRQDRLVLTVEDDGRGFDCHQQGEAVRSRNYSLGLSIMEERARSCDGRFTLESQPGRGTQVMVEIPFGPAGDEEKKERPHP